MSLDDLKNHKLMSDNDVWKSSSRFFGNVAMSSICSLFVLGFVLSFWVDPSSFLAFITYLFGPFFAGLGFFIWLDKMNINRLMNQKTSLLPSLLRNYQDDDFLNLTSDELKELTLKIEKADPALQNVWRSWLLQADLPIRRRDARLMEKAVIPPINPMKDQAVLRQELSKNLATLPESLDIKIDEDKEIYFDPSDSAVNLAHPSKG